MQAAVPSRDTAMSETTKPRLSEAQVLELVQRLYGLERSTVRPLPSYDDQNFHVVAPGGGGEYVLKVMNSADSTNPTMIDVQTRAMSFLQEHGIPAQTAVRNAAGELMNLEEIDCGFGCQKFMVRLLTYLPGTTISTVPYTPQLLYDVGKMAARMDQVFLKMDHPHLSALQRDSFIWSLSNVPLLEGYVYSMDGDPLQEVVKVVIEEFKTSVLPRRHAFRKCLNHGDFNDLNILVEPDQSGDYRISGILDFSDMNSGHYVHELAIAIMYMMIQHPDPVAVGQPVTQGWESVVPLNPEERDCLYLLVLCRFCQSLVMARHSVRLQPHNEEYLMITARTGMRILRQLWDLGKAEVEKVWFQDGQGRVLVGDGDK
ncbi:hydroxylysine kinase isoform X2 [Gadus morhua]|uniref:hydroxylysine kinase isoform X2 n=1 Tax=Gadus morhua TaxID=8049 RepID=UPI0011B47E01|nr:hydroxylysine kinase isoform X2 [Gadus morhua]XP_030228674.1 hydroxylysine kinase isoform X2 [Gadus morhua]